MLNNTRQEEQLDGLVMIFDSLMMITLQKFFK